MMDIPGVTPEPPAQSIDQTSPGPIPVETVDTTTQQDKLLQTAEYVRVYVLGTRGGKRYIEEFEGATGYHIRTIPAYRRFENPVMLGAGAGKLAVVDRFGDTDLIRVTTPTCGAPDAAFDSNGFPLDSFDWHSSTDLIQINTKVLIANAVGISTTPQPFVVGLTISPRGILIATLNTGFITWDVLNGHPQYSTAHALVRDFEGFTFVGHPTAQEQLTTQGVHLFTSSAISPEGTSCVLFTDYLTGYPVYGVAGPDAVSLGSTVNGEIVNMFMAANSEDCDQILRCRYSRAGLYTDVSLNEDLQEAKRFRVFHSYHAQRLNVPTPSDQLISTTYPNSDWNHPAENPDPAFLDGVNRNPRRTQMASSEESTTGGGPGRPISPAATTGSLNLNRTVQDEVSLPSSLPLGAGKAVNLSWKRIATPALARVRKAAALYNVIAELAALPDNPTSSDAQSPLYRLVFGTHYDYLSDGGYVYGCVGANDTVVPVNDLLAAFDIALDRSPEHGTLKELPDAKFTLVDTKTGLILPENPIKSLGYNVYAGNFAALKTVTTSDEGFFRATDTTCSTLFWSAQEVVDGLHRYFANANNSVVSSIPEVAAHVIAPTTLPASIAKTTDTVRPLDTPWSCFQPRIVPPPRLLAAPAMQSWTRHDDDGAFLDHWLPAAMRVNPVVELSQSSQILYPPKGSATDTSIFAVSCAGGFFFLDWPKQRVDRDSVTTFEIPSSIQNALVGPMDPTPAQVDPLTPETVAAVATGQAPAFLQKGAGIGAYPLLNRAVGFDTNIRSWVAVEIKLDRGGSVTDGCAAWSQPSTLDNGLGINVGREAYAIDLATRLCSPAGDPVNPSGASAGYAYDAGDVASSGAFGAWEIDVFFNGVPAKKIATRATYTEQISQAPQEAQALLESTMQASGGVGAYGYHKGRAYFSPEVIKTVTIKARLVNYAFDVYRVGYHTINFAHPDYFGGLTFCSGNDPGFFASNNCEATCCGNVSCLSQIFFGNKLFASDPVRPVVVNVLWEGEVSYSIPDANNPYLALNNGVGYLMSAYMEFNLNSAMSAWNVNLRTGSNGRSPLGTGI
jgi:hypothetical protein